MFRKGEYKMDNEKVYSMSFSKIYPLLVNKAVKKGRSVEEVNQVIGWLTGYRTEEIEAAAESSVSYGDFFRHAPELNPNRTLIKGVVCGVRPFIRLPSGRGQNRCTQHFMIPLRISHVHPAEEMESLSRHCQTLL